MKSVDYSDKAISMRIRQVAQLRKLCLSLAKSTPLPPTSTTPSTSKASSDR
jgi:hypothetical protein